MVIDRDSSKKAPITDEIRKEKAELDAVGKSTLEFMHIAGKKVVKLLDQHQLQIGQIVELSKHFNLAMVLTLENIGRGRLLPEVVLSSDVAVQKLKVFPIEDQKRLSKPGAKVEVYIKRNGEAARVEMKLFNKLTTKESNQVIDGGKLRDKREQKAFTRSVTAPDSKVPNYVITEDTFSTRRIFSEDLRTVLLSIAEHATGMDVRLFNEAVAKRKEAGRVKERLRRGIELK